MIICIYVSQQEIYAIYEKYKHKPAHPLATLFAQSFTRSLTQSLTHLHNHSLIHSLIHSLVHSPAIPIRSMSPLTDDTDCIFGTTQQPNHRPVHAGITTHGWVP